MSEKAKRKRVKRGTKMVTVATDWPYWTGGTKRQWLAKKRRHAKAVALALDAMRLGSVFLNSYGVDGVTDVCNRVDKWRQALRGAR